MPVKDVPVPALTLPKQQISAKPPGAIVAASVIWLINNPLAEVVTSNSTAAWCGWCGRSYLPAVMVRWSCTAGLPNRQSSDGEVASMLVYKRDVNQMHECCLTSLLAMTTASTRRYFSAMYVGSWSCSKHLQAYLFDSLSRTFGEELASVCWPAC